MTTGSKAGDNLVPHCSGTSCLYARLGASCPFVITPGVGFTYLPLDVRLESGRLLSYQFGAVLNCHWFRLLD